MTEQGLIRSQSQIILTARPWSHKVGPSEEPESWTSVLQRLGGFVMMDIQWVPDIVVGVDFGMTCTGQS